MIAPNRTARGTDSLISVVLPQYNEGAILTQLVELVEAALVQCTDRYEIIFVNDGSTDGSGELLDDIADANSNVKVLHFSRNFGHQAAVQAGLEYARGDAVIVMDSDLQDDPKAIIDFVAEWRNGADVVYAERTKRKESLPKRVLFYSFYRFLNAISDTPIPNDAGNFGLMDRRAVDSIVSLRDTDRYFPGLRRWVGFKQVGVIVERLERHDDNPRVSFAGLFRLAKSAIFSFSRFPLTMFYGIAGLSAAVFGVFLAFCLYHKVVTGLAIPGWTSVIMTASFFGSLNALGIGILGEYVVRIYDQVRARPGYIVQRASGDGMVNHQGREMLNWLAKNQPAAAVEQASPASVVGH
jgi:dolichol-phosphate mannosyltransferase